MKTIASLPQLSLQKMRTGESWSFDFQMVRLTITPDGEFRRKSIFKATKRFIEHNEHGYLFVVELANEEQEATDELEALENALSFLRKKVLLYTNSNGEIISIASRREIQENWNDKEKEVRKAFKKSIPKIDDILEAIKAILNDGKDFLQFVLKSEVYSLLFPPIYDAGLLNAKFVIQEKIIPDFFEHCALPLKLQTRIEAKNLVTNGLQIIRTGKLNTFLFEEEKVSRFFSKAFEIHSSNLDYKATCFEGYDLDDTCAIDKVNSILNVEIPNVFAYRHICKLIKNQ